MKIMPINRLISELDNIKKYESKKCCFSGCDNNPINSHTIPENFLYKIDLDLRNVLSLEPRVYWIVKNGEDNKLVNVDKGEFSTFKGFCIDHDTKLFFKVDNYDGKINNEIALLIHYRNLCNGIYHICHQMLKEEHLRAQNFISNDDSYAKEHAMLKSKQLEKRLKYCLEEHSKRKKMMERMIREKKFNSINYRIMTGPVINPIFCGRSSIILHQNEKIFRFPGYSNMPWVSYITLIHGDKSELVFCWLNQDEKYSKQAIRKMEQTSHRDMIALLAYGASDASAIHKDLYEKHREIINSIVHQYRVY